MAKAKRPSKRPPLHRRVKRHHIGIGLIAALLVWGGVAFVSTRPADVLACNAVTSLQITNPSPNAVLTGGVTLQAKSATALTTPLSFWLNSTQLSVPTGSTDGGITWTAQWNSATISDGSYQLTAQTQTQNGGYCSSPITVSVKNSTVIVSGQVVIGIQPGSWNGDTNINVPFSAHVGYKDSSGNTQDVTAQSQYSWSTSLGVITGNGPTATYYSGPYSGSGYVTVVATYNGQKASISAPVKVTSVTSSNTTTTISPSPTPSQQLSGTDSGDETPHPVSQPMPIEVAQCLIKAVGQTRYNAITNGQSEPTQDERLKGAVCFQPIHVIPARLAPVDPAKVDSLPQSVPALQVGGAKTEDVTANGKVKQQLALSGKGVPGSTVYIYVFSEPLVLQTAVDNQGNWSYSLDNPLKPGHHQVYAVMQQAGGQFVRSLPLPITIAQAAASSDNPQGNSLQIQQDRAVEFSSYILGALLVVIVGLRALFVLRRRIKMPNGA